MGGYPYIKREVLMLDKIISAANSAVAVVITP